MYSRDNAARLIVLCSLPCWVSYQLRSIACCAIFEHFFRFLSRLLCFDFIVPNLHFKRFSFFVLFFNIFLLCCIIIGHLFWGNLAIINCLSSNLFLSGLHLYWQILINDRRRIWQLGLVHAMTWRFVMTQKCNLCQYLKTFFKDMLCVGWSRILHAYVKLGPIQK